MQEIMGWLDIFSLLTTTNKPPVSFKILIICLFTVNWPFNESPDWTDVLQWQEMLFHVNCICRVFKGLCVCVPECDEDQFSCSNGLCRPQYFVCDRVNDCGDNSDELHCGECLISSGEKCCGLLLNNVKCATSGILFFLKEVTEAQSLRGFTF